MADERKLTILRRDSVSDWWVIEWLEHEHVGRLEQTATDAATYHWSGRVSDADIEGTSYEMLAIASAIEQTLETAFARCAVQPTFFGFAIWSPRNSTWRGEISVAQGRQLAAEIRRVLAPAEVAS